MEQCFSSFIGGKNFPGGSDGKASAYNVGSLGLIPGSGRSPGRRKWQRTPVPLPGKSHGRRSPVGYSPWGHIESDMTDFTLTFSQEEKQPLGSMLSSVGWEFCCCCFHNAQGPLISQISSLRCF